MSLSPRFGIGVTAIAVTALAGAVILAQGPSRLTVSTAGTASDDGAFPPILHIDETAITPPPVPTPPTPPVPPPPPPISLSGTITINSKTNAAVDDHAAARITLPAGTYRITRESGCSRSGTTNADRWSLQDLRVSYPNWDLLGTPVTMAWPDRTESASSSACAQRASNTVLTVQHGGGSMAFWVADSVAKDNQGSIVLRYRSAPTLEQVQTTLFCSATTVRTGEVVMVRGTSSPALANTAVAIALPTGGTAPQRFAAMTDAEGAFAIAIPVTKRPTTALAIDALWPLPDSAIAQPSAPCVLPIDGDVDGYRAAVTQFARAGTPEQATTSPDDPYASTRVGIVWNDVPAMRPTITRLEYDRNPTDTSAPGRGVRFLRVVSDLDPRFAKSGTVRFTLTPNELRGVRAPTSILRIAQYQAATSTWRTLTTNNLSKGGRGIVESVITPADLRDGIFGLIAR